MIIVESFSSVRLLKSAFRSTLSTAYVVAVLRSRLPSFTTTLPGAAWSTADTQCAAVSTWRLPTSPPPQLPTEVSTYAW